MTEPKPAPGTEPNPASGTEPRPAPGAEPRPAPGAEPRPAPDLSRVRDEHCNRLYDRYDRKAKSLLQFSRVLVVFAGFYLLFVLVPLVLMQRENRQIQTKLERLRQLETQADELQARYDSYQQARGGIAKLQQQMAQGGQNVMSFVNGLGDLALQPEAPDDPCRTQAPASPTETTDATRWDETLATARQTDSQAVMQWMDCTAREKLAGEFQKYLDTFEHEVSAPLVAAEPALELELEKSFEDVVTQRPAFWTADQKDGRPVARLEKAAFLDFWQGQTAQVDRQAESLKSQLEAMTAELTELRKDEEKLESQQKDIVARQARLEKRLEGLESPMGRLPIGLDESIQVFPAVLALGFWVCATLLRDALRLRRNFQAAYLGKDPSGTLLDEHQVSLVAPLMFDPADPDQSWLEKSAIVLLPFLVLAGSIGLILYNWSVSGSLAKMDRAELNFYMGLYALCFATMAHGLGQVALELRRHLREPTATAPDSEPSETKS